MTTPKRILVPTDFSDQSSRALEWAKNLASVYGASLHLLTVVPEPFVLPDPGTFSVPLPSGYVDGLRRDAEAHLHAALSPAERERLNARSAVLFGHPYGEILDYATRERIDLIVMGTHGRGALGRAVLGSVAERIVRTAPCPVLTVR